MTNEEEFKIFDDKFKDIPSTQGKMFVLNKGEDVEMIQSLVAADDVK